MNPVLTNLHNQTGFNNFNLYGNFARPAETTYYPEFHEEAADYSFFPKTNFFDNHINSPLNATRQNTAATDTSEYTSQNPRTPSPVSNSIQKNLTQDFSCNITSFNGKEVFPQAAKTNKFTAVLGAGTGISFNALQEKSQSQPLKVPFSFDKKDSDEDGDGNSLLDEEDGNQEAIQNAQLQSLLKSGVWTEDKDQNLLKLGSQYKCDWKKIAKRFNHKKITPHFLKIRYKELTCAPLQRRVKFNHKEDLMISKYFERYGSNWAQMATHFCDRTAIMLKNRYYSFIRKKDLLDSLLQEVREIEKTGQEVDKLPDTDAYTNPTSLMKDITSGNEETVSPSSMEEPYLSEKGEKHQIYEYDSAPASNYLSQNNNKTKWDEVADGQNKGAAHKDEAGEINALREQVKIYQNLYLQTKAELDRIKNSNKMF